GVAEEQRAPPAVDVVALAQRLGRGAQPRHGVPRDVGRQLEQPEIAAAQPRAGRAAGAARGQRPERRRVSGPRVQPAAPAREDVGEVLHVHGYHALIWRRSRRGAAKRYTARALRPRSRVSAQRPEAMPRSRSSIWDWIGPGRTSLRQTIVFAIWPTLSK